MLFRKIGFKNRIRFSSIKHFMKRIGISEPLT